MRTPQVGRNLWWLRQCRRPRVGSGGIGEDREGSGGIRAPGGEGVGRDSEGSREPGGRGWRHPGRGRGSRGGRGDGRRPRAGSGAIRGAGGSPIGRHPGTGWESQNGPFSQAIPQGIFVFGTSPQVVRNWSATGPELVRKWSGFGATSLQKWCREGWPYYTSSQRTRRPKAHNTPGDPSYLGVGGF